MSYSASSSLTGVLVLDKQVAAGATGKVTINLKDGRTFTGNLIAVGDPVAAFEATEVPPKAVPGPPTDREVRRL